MGFISESGTGFAAPIKGLAALLLAPLMIGAVPTGSLDLSIEGLRSQRGDIQLCMTMLPAKFPSCKGDPNARRMTVPAAQAAKLRIENLPQGQYAIAVIHDENSNAKLDTALGIPREGFGFSRNPVIMFGPPRFSAAEFRVGDGETAQRLKMKYLL